MQAAEGGGTPPLHTASGKGAVAACCATVLFIQWLGDFLTLVIKFKFFKPNFAYYIKFVYLCKVG